MGLTGVVRDWPTWVQSGLEQKTSLMTTFMAFIILLCTFLIGGLLALASWNLFLHPLAGFPGPLLSRISPVYMYVVSYLGVEGRVLRDLHERYQSEVVRVAPGSLSISNSAAIRDIYVSGGGFMKDARYSNFDLGPVVSVFSSRDTRYRDVRAKAVAPLFSPARLRAASRPGGVITQSVAAFVSQLQEFRLESLRIDILDWSARLAMDVTSSYLLGRAYGGLTEHAHLRVQERRDTHLSANPFIAAIVRFGRFSLLPNRAFKLAYALSSWLSASEVVTKSATQLNHFVSEIVQATCSNPMRESEGTYQARLIDAGIDQAEAGAQAKAVLFAGADSIAVMLATIIFHITRNRDVQQHLEREAKDCGDAVDGDAASTRPYLRAVVKEGLRLGMTNPTRMTRIVPDSGFRLGETFMAPDSIVGCSPAVLHHDSEVFPDPFSFRPERWLDGEDGEGLRRPNMERNMIPYGVGLRACLGKNLAQQLLHHAVASVIESGVLGGARTCQDKIELIQWFNAEIKGHKLEIEW